MAGRFLPLTVRVLLKDRFRAGPLGSSDKPSDNGARQRQTKRDVLRHRNLSDLQ